MSKTIDLISPIEGSVHMSRQALTHMAGIAAGALAPIEIEDRGREAGLSVLGFHALTHPKSRHLKKLTA